MNESKNSLHQEYLKLIEFYGYSLDESTAPTAIEMDEYYIEADTNFQNLEFLPTELKQKAAQTNFIPQNIFRTQSEAWDSIVRLHESWLTEVLIRVGWKIETPVLVRQFPTGSFNAQARKSSSGILVLLNTGLFSLLNKMSKILYLAALKNWDNNEIDKIILDLVNRFTIIREDVTKIPFPALPHPLRLINIDHVFWMERFVLAHEYGHILNGDLNTNLMSTIDTPIGKLEVISKSQEAELKADFVALHLLINEYNKTQEETLLKDKTLQRKDNWKAILILSAPLYFFEIAQLIEDVIAARMGKLKEGIKTDHPPSYVRANQAWYIYEKNLSQDELIEVSRYVNWLRERSRSIFGVDNEGNFTGKGLIN